MNKMLLAVSVAIVCSGPAKAGPHAFVAGPDVLIAGPRLLVDGQGAAAGSPTVTGPVTGGKGQPQSGFPPNGVPQGYMEEEYFVSGTAVSYLKKGPWAVDGVWAATPGTSAEYRARLLVRRPQDARRFNGTVIVEWLNVTALSEGAADYMQMQEEILREGYAWVGVGAQAAGVNSPGTGLKAWDPQRYASLVHPGDAYSYDIFSQAARALRHPGERDLLHGLRIRHVLATGRSQSAFRLVTYVNAVHPLHKADRLFDGYFIHSRGANAAGIAAAGMAGDQGASVPVGAHIRTDIDVPVLDVQTEGDMITLRSHLTRQPASAHYRRWEIAGAAHAETPRWVVQVPPPLDFGQGCRDAVNAAPHHAVVKAGLAALARWVRSGAAPKQSPEIELLTPSAPDPGVVRDAHGNAKGGIRLPELEAPTATLDGTVNAPAQTSPGGQNFCRLFGRTVIFEPAKIGSLYQNHDAFVKRFNAAADALVREGYWLRPEADLAKAAARAAKF